MENSLESAKVYDGNSCSNSNLRSCLNNLSCGPKDIVFFGYFGHGARSTGDSSEFPQICLGSGDPSDFVPLEDVRDALMKKGARFVFVMGDCCNSYANIPKKRGTLSAAGPTTLSSSNSVVIRKLFGMKGAVISAGCKKGEYSWVNSISGGFFTNGFLDEFDNYLDADPANPDWNNLFEKVRSNVVSVSRERLKSQGNYVQTPIWRVDKEESPKIITDKNRDDNKPIIDDGTIRSKLMLLINKSEEQVLRKSHISEVRRLFSQDCVVEIYGKDGETLLGVKKVDSYLRTITASPFLNNFIIRHEERDSSGKITLLRVHEIYLKN